MPLPQPASFLSFYQFSLFWYDDDFADRHLRLRYHHEELNVNLLAWFLTLQKIGKKDKHLNFHDLHNFWCSDFNFNTIEIWIDMINQRDSEYKEQTRYKVLLWIINIILKSTINLTYWCHCIIIIITRQLHMHKIANCNAACSSEYLHHYNIWHALHIYHE